MWFLYPAHFSHLSVSSCVWDVTPTLVILTASPCAPETGSTHTLQWSFAFEIGVSSRNYVVIIFSLHKYFWCVIERETPLAKVCSLSVSLIFPPKRLLFLSLAHLGSYRMDHMMALRDWMSHYSCMGIVCHVRPWKYFLEWGAFLLTHLKRFLLKSG